MSDYLLPDGMTAAAASRALADKLAVSNGSARICARCYYDTFDGLLHAAGLTAVWEEGQLALVEPDSDRVRARATIGKPTKPLLASDLGGGPLCDALKPLIDVRALLPLVEIRCRERPLDVLDGERKTVVRLRVQQPALGQPDDAAAGHSGGAGRRARGKAVRLPPRVHVTAVRGYDKALTRVAHTLENELGFKPATRPLLDEAVAASGAEPGGTQAKIRVAMTRSERADRAAAAVLRALLRVIELNLPGTLADLDTEFLHDLRVSVRRTRAVQRELRGVFPPAELSRFREEFRWLQQATGEVRDLDVYVLDFEEMRALVPERVRPDLEPLLDALRARHTAARRRMVRALRAERSSKLLAEWGGLLDGLESLPVQERPDATLPIAAVAGGRIATVYRRMVRMGEAIGPDSPSTDYHELRKQGKELRYLLELFGRPLFPDEVVRAMIRALKALQDVLGRHQDREIQVTMLRSLGPELSAASDGPSALMAMGMLVERLEEDQQAARSAFAPRFAAFASRHQRKLVKETFR
jgi:CHAD domain-containing protein